jgi:hypothetical protein
MTPIKASEFSEKHLELSGVWTWQGDLHESEDSLVPVPLTEEALEEAKTLLIHAQFETASGRRLHGLVVYQLGDVEIYAIEILIGSQKFTFNKHVPDLSTTELNRLALSVHEDAKHLLPIRYAIVPRQLSIESGEFFF